jgi:hypothetical protein
VTEEQRSHAKQIRGFAPEGKPVGALAAFGEILRRACNHLIPHAPGWRWSNFPERC